LLESDCLHRKLTFGWTPRWGGRNLQYVPRTRKLCFEEAQETEDDLRLYRDASRDARSLVSDGQRYQLAWGRAMYQKRRSQSRIIQNIERNRSKLKFVSDKK